MIILSITHFILVGKNIIKNVEYERDMDRVAHMWHGKKRDLYKSYYNMADPKGKYVNHYIQIDRGDVK